MSSLKEQLRVQKVRNSARFDRILELARGLEDIQHFVDEQEQMNAYVLLPREIAANHVHPNFKEETGYVLFGQLDVFLQNATTRERYHERITPGYKFTIPIGIAHATRNPQFFYPTVFLETSTLAFNPALTPQDVRRDQKPSQVITPDFIDTLYSFKRRVLKQ